MALIGTYQLRVTPAEPVLPAGMPAGIELPPLPEQVFFVPDVYARVTSIAGHKNEMQALLSIFVDGTDPDYPEQPAKRCIDTLFLKFVPELNSDNFIAQAYAQYVLHPQCAAMASDE
ncbi:hypothetical protein [Hydrocarboniphaga effusa]|uniref:hypothetical protein n=1 Tax=Hydrocarboniphaga effusa TaxID=243629 RepID=UPI00398C0BFB